MNRNINKFALGLMRALYSSMTKTHADRILKGGKILGLETNVQGVPTAENEYRVTFFHQSQLAFQNYFAARGFLLALELEKGKPIG
jgi:hypothetical protein